MLYGVNMKGFGDCDPVTERKCYDCEDYEMKLDSARDYFEMIINELFSMDRLDVETLEANLENLAFVLDRKLPDVKIQVIRQPQRPHVLQQWLRDNYSCLKELSLRSGYESCDTKR